MKKIIITFISITLFAIIILTVILSTVGYKTNKFNEIISSGIKKNNEKISLIFKDIKFKFDFRNASLFLNTNNPSLSYQKVNIPINNIKVYLKLFPLLKSETKINKIVVQSKKINVSNLKEIIYKTQPSNLNSLIVNNINNGQFFVNLELYFNEDATIKDFIAKGEVKKLTGKLIDKLKFKNTNFNFFADKTDVLIKNIKSEVNGIKLKEGNLKIQKNKEDLNLTLNVLSDINLNTNTDQSIKPFLDNELFDDQVNLNGSLTHNLIMNFDNTLKVTRFNYTSKGKVNDLFLNFNNKLSSTFLKNNLTKLSFKESDVDIRYSSDNNNFINSSGKYRLNDLNYLNYDFKIDFKDENLDLNINCEFDESLNLDIINYNKDTKLVANISTVIQKKENEIFFKKIQYKENNNLIFIENLKLIKNKIISLKKLVIKTYLNKDIKNDFTLNFGKNIIISGKKYDSSNLIKIINSKKNENFFIKISKSIDISLDEIETPLSKTLSNFKLLGEIQKGEFTKISSKGDFDEQRFLDISLKSDKKNKKKYFEIYSDFPQPLLSEYSFFDGLSEGKLMFSSIIEDNLSNSKLTIDNFKLKNAPAVIKLLSLADFGGLADLASGEGLSFDKLEINMSSDEKVLTLKELYAVGPSISVLMEGYKENNGITSLRGTLVPAKNLNKFLSKIPVIGDIIIPQDVGEGLFGVSFKMKGPSGKIKTTINPIKTLTPRFITKALEKSKKTK